MSVIHFGAEELANVVTYLGASPYADPSGLKQTIDDLITYSEINTRAFNARYRGESAMPVTPGELINEISTLVMSRPYSLTTKADNERARATLQLLEYNTEAEHHTYAFTGAMLRLLIAAYTRVLSEIEDSGSALP